MICTSVIPWSFNALAKTDKIMSTFVLFSPVFPKGHFERLALFRKWGDKP